MTGSRSAVIFDLDGVLTDTAELHYQSWQRIADELGLPFDRHANEALRGLSRPESLLRVLGAAAGRFDEGERQRLLAQKNEDYLARVARLSPADLLPGIGALLRGLAGRGVPMAVASSSRNALAVMERLGIAARFAAIVDGNHAPRSKPDPQVFLLAAERLAVAPAVCAAVEDAESGVESARAAGMFVIGVGPAERVGRAHRVVPDTSWLTPRLILDDPA